MTTLPIREMVLYKHGVGYFVRGGIVSGTQAVLTFKQDALNDVLKSLTVFDRSGGHVLGIHYPTPIPREERLSSSSIQLSNENSLRDLLTQIRGRQITVSLEHTLYEGDNQTKTTEIVSGRMIGIETPLPSGHERTIDHGKTRVTMQTDAGVRVFELVDLKSFTIDDAAAANDLTYTLDVSMSDDERRDVTIQLSEGEHDLIAQYVAPSPLWRVSYRLVADADETGAITEAYLQGWGLFDNRFEEDLTDIRLTLVAGQPISFVYDLSESQIPERPLIRDKARVAQAPIEFLADHIAAPNFDEMTADETLRYMESLAKRQGGVEDVLKDIDGMVLGGAEHELGAASQYQSARFMRAGGGRGIVESAPAQAAAKEAGEFFEYQVQTPVTVKRGESALVPLFSAEVKPERELLFNHRKLQNHPVAALRLKNTSGFTLERGPVTVAVEGDYKGEAIIAFTKDGDDLYVPYAVELGVKVAIDEKQEVTDIGVALRDKMFFFQRYRTTIAAYMIENTLNQPVTILIERGVIPDVKPFDSPVPDVETVDERRWKLTLPAKTRRPFVIKERTVFSTHHILNGLTMHTLAEYLDKRYLDKALYGTLRPIVERYEAARNARSEINTLQNEKKTIATRQEQIRANLATLQTVGEEGKLRMRILKQLEKSEDRLAAIDAREAELNQIIVTKEAEAKALIDALPKGE